MIEDLLSAHKVVVYPMPHQRRGDSMLASTRDPTKASKTRRRCVTSTARYIAPGRQSKVNGDAWSRARFVVRWPKGAAEPVHFPCASCLLPPGCRGLRSPICAPRRRVPDTEDILNVPTQIGAALSSSSLLHACAPTQGGSCPDAILGFHARCFCIVGSAPKLTSQRRYHLFPWLWVTSRCKEAVRIQCQ